jgi:hypothetical protein
LHPDDTAPKVEGRLRIANQPFVLGASVDQSLWRRTGFCHSSVTDLPHTFSNQLMRPGFLLSI